MQFHAQADWYRQHYADASFDVVLVDGEPAGRLYLHRGETEIRIVDIALLPEHRGSGIATSLLRDLLAEADAAGKSVTIHVERLNPALPAEAGGEVKPQFSPAGRSSPAHSSGTETSRTIATVNAMRIMTPNEPS